jgi:hypothetical protein
LALELGYIDNPKMGWYLLKGEDKQRRRADIEDDEEIMETFLQNKEFCDKVEKKYAL